MAYEEIKKALNSKDYDFLRDNPYLQDNIVLLGLGGSFAYGTNIETSDIDIRGIALNSKSDILLGRDFEQVTDTKTDTVIYSFMKMVSLLCNANPNTIEILGLKDDQYFIKNKIGQVLLDNKDLFLSQKCIQSFGGYANQQLYRLNQKAKHSMPQEELEKHILKTLEFMRSSLTHYTPMGVEELNLYVDKSDREDMDTEIYMDVNVNHYPLRDYCGLWNELQNTVRQYNKVGVRNSKAIEHGKIAKHSMHLIRLYMMCLDILEKGEINTYRDGKDHELLMDIRNGKYLVDNQPIPEFFEMVNEYEKRLDYAKANTNLPLVPDRKKVDDFVMSINEMIINNEYKTKVDNQIDTLMEYWGNYTNCPHGVLEDLDALKDLDER